MASSATHGVFDVLELVEQNFKKFDKWIDKNGRVINKMQLGILFASKTPLPQ